MSIRSNVDFLHKKLGNHALTTRLALLLRNQCNCIIKYHLGGDAHSNVNGEDWLAGIVAPETTHFVDVGANVGNWTEFFLSALSATSRQKGQVKGILFEPSSIALSKLEEKFAHLDNIKIIKAAVSDIAGEMTYFEESGAGETSSLINQHSSSHADAKKVKVVTLDEAMKELGLERIDFLKIDVEGYDFHVLRGASNLIKEHRVGIIQFEYNEPWVLAGSTLFEAYQFLEAFGYKVFLLKADALYIFNYSRYGDFFRYSNFVAISPEKMPSMEKFVGGHI